MQTTRIKIPENMILEAWDYASKSKSYTSNRHDFHAGGLNNKEQKMFEGKLGEKLFKVLLEENSIPYKEDDSDHTEADFYDFLLPKNCTVDVKTRTQDFHTRTLEMVEQINNRPKRLYISCRLYIDSYEGDIIGWCTKGDFLNADRIENQGYLNNYVLYDEELRPIQDLFDRLKKKLT